MKIIHISDLHYPKYGSVTNLISKIIIAYKNSATKPLIILTGDLVHEPSKKNFTAVKKRLNALKDNNFPLLICPGNHDYKIGGNVGIRQKRMKKLFNLNFSKFLLIDKNVHGEVNNNFYRFPLVHKIDNNYFIGIDTMNKKTYLATGKIGTNQLDKVKKEIEQIKNENAEAVITVYMHHKPFWFNWNYHGFDYDSMKLKNSEDFLNIVNGVDILLFGHHHRNKQLFDEQEEHNIKVILNGSDSTSGKLEWYEVDTDSFRVSHKYN